MANMQQVSDVSITSCLAPDHVDPTAFIPKSGNLFPKWPSHIDAESWDSWQFQGMSADGSIAVGVVFFRHMIHAPAGFRVGINASWAGSESDKREEAVWCGPVMFPRSVITSDATSTMGVWSSDNNDDTVNDTVSFNISADLSQATLSLNVPGKVTGTLAFRTLIMNVPVTEAEFQASSFSWLHPIPLATVDANLVFVPQEKGTIERGMSAYGEAGRELKLRSDEGSIGSFDRAWAVDLPHKVVSHNWLLWGRSGRYLISVLWMMGRPAADGVLHGTASLYCDGELVCKTAEAVHLLEDGTGKGDTFSLEYLDEEGGITGSFPPKNTGHRVLFMSAKKEWEFNFRHARPWYEMPIGPPRPGRTGLSGFMVSVSGGLKGSAESSSGTGFVGGGIMP